MISKYFKGKFDNFFIRFFTFLPVHRGVPLIFTLIGLIFSLFGGIAFAFKFILLGGVFIIFAGLFDILDGAYARVFRKASSFGAFIDSTVDRYADMFILSGIGIQYAIKDKLFYLFLTFVVTIGFVMVSYTKARAETFIKKCDVGLMERPERLILLIIGAFFQKLEIILWILAVLTHFTALQRIWFTHKQIEVEVKEVV